MHPALGRPINYVYLAAFVAAALSGDAAKIGLAVLLAGVVVLHAVLCSARRSGSLTNSVAPARRAGRRQEAGVRA